MDDYEFHYPQELSRDNLDEVREALDGHGIYCRRDRDSTSTRASARAASPRPTTRCAREALG